jgi:hypothetical protein
MKYTILFGGGLVIAATGLSYHPDFSQQVYGWVLVVCGVAGAVAGVAGAIRRHRGY